MNVKLSRSLLMSTEEIASLAGYMCTSICIIQRDQLRSDDALASWPARASIAIRAAAPIKAPTIISDTGRMRKVI